MYLAIRDATYSGSCIGHVMTEHRDWEFDKRALRLSTTLTQAQPALWESCPETTADEVPLSIKSNRRVRARYAAAGNGDGGDGGEARVQASARTPAAMCERRLGGEFRVPPPSFAGGEPWAKSSSNPLSSSRLPRGRTVRQR